MKNNTLNFINNLKNGEKVNIHIFHTGNEVHTFHDYIVIILMNTS